MKKFFLTAALAMVFAVSFAQKPIIKFTEAAYNFGDIQEANGPVTHEFEFTNTGEAPLVVHDVKASCGCTTPSWTRTPIQKGKTGSVKVTFNPSGRPGNFNKTITVNSNMGTPVTLRIAGNVLQKPKTFEDEYPVVFDSLRLTDNHLPFTKLGPTDVKTVEIDAVNTSKQDVTPTFINVPAHITIVCDPATIKPGKSAKIKATYNAAVKNDWGFVSDQIYVIFDEKKKYTNRITASATIAEDFSKLTEEQKANAPVIEFDNKTFDFGTIAQGAKVEHDYVVTNKGKENLIIRKVKASCGCTAVSPAKNILAPGESTNIHVAFDSRGKSGRQQKSITIISNDPNQSNMILRISGTVTTVKTQQ